MLYDQPMSSFPGVPRFSIAEYMAWKGDWELWDGIPVAMSPSPVDRHQEIVLEILFALRGQLPARPECRCRVRSELDWHADIETVLRPDVMVLCDGDPDADYPDAATIPPLVVEVLSPSTRSRDLGWKLDRYREFGVSNYFVVDPADRLLDRRLGGDPDGQRSDSLTIRLHEGCEVTLPRRIPEEVV